MKIYKPHLLQIVYIENESGQFYVTSFKEKSEHLLYEIQIFNTIYFSEEADMNIIGKIHKLYNPFKSC